MGFKEGALERKRPGNPVRDLLGASSVPAMMPWWGEGHWETLCRPASGPALFRDEGTVLHEAEQEQSPLGQTTRLQLWLPPPLPMGLWTGAMWMPRPQCGGGSVPVSGAQGKVILICCFPVECLEVAINRRRPRGIKQCVYVKHPG